MDLLQWLLEWEESKKFINLKSVIKAKTSDIISFLNENAHKKGEKSWLFMPTGSDNKICLVAHIDRIFESPKKLQIIKKKHGEKRRWSSPAGIGGDDRCGVWALLHLWRTLPAKNKPILLFTHEEETGLFGAKEAVKVFKDELKNVSFFIELDRRGHKEMVFYNYEPEEFKKHIGTYGFKEKVGSTSDIRILGKHFKKVSANLSVGYYDQHTKGEYIIVKHLLETIEKVKNICITNAPLSKEAAKLPPEPKYPTYTYRGSFYDDEDSIWSNWNKRWGVDRGKTEHKYSVGDKVKVVRYTNYRNDNDYVGKTGVIKHVASHGSLPYDVKMDTEDGITLYLDDYNIEPIDGKKKEKDFKHNFKVNDRVQLIKYVWNYNLVGKFGRITKVSNVADYPYDVMLDGGKKVYVSDSNLRLASKKDDKKNNDTIVEGDIVKILKYTFKSKPQYIGETGQVVYVSTNNRILGVKIREEEKPIFVGVDDVEKQKSRKFSKEEIEKIKNEVKEKRKELNKQNADKISNWEKEAKDFAKKKSDELEKNRKENIKESEEIIKRRLIR